MVEYRFDGQEHVATFGYHEHRPLGDHTPEQHNESHLWGWDRPGFEQMIEAAGFDIYSSAVIEIPPYPMTVQFVLAERKPA